MTRNCPKCGSMMFPVILDDGEHTQYLLPSWRCYACGKYLMPQADPVSATRGPQRRPEFNPNPPEHRKRQKHEKPGRPKGAKTIK